METVIAHIVVTHDTDSGMWTVGINPGWHMPLGSDASGYVGGVTASNPEDALRLLGQSQGVHWHRTTIKLKEAQEQD